ncbi:MAG: hypothetical protein WA989_14675 [Henriciella sp.]|uniref:glycosyltransferase family 4 protein n=1 Tax=Henriciella sp. TaxID=1968823 RepID=UPI003C746FDF
MTILVTLALAACTFIVSVLLCAAMKRSGIVDAPDGYRKLQTSPVPRLGGVGIMSAIALVLGPAAVFHSALPALLARDWLPGAVPTVWHALGASFMFAAFGALDDIVELPALPKLLLVLVVCIAAPFLGIAVAAFETPFGFVNAPLLMMAGSALWLLVFVNAANFMDGSNGLSLGSMAIMLAGLGLCMMMSTRGGFPAGLACIIAAIGGFLVYNLRGTLYAGDAGAFGIGGLFATLGLVSGLPVWTVATLALPFLVDVLLTLVSRTKRKQPLFTAHRDHAYQALIKAGWSHIEVALVWWCLSAACAIAASVGAASGGDLPFVLFWTFALGLSAGWVFLHGKARKNFTGRARG